MQFDDSTWFSPVFVDGLDELNSMLCSVDRSVHRSMHHIPAPFQAGRHGASIILRPAFSLTGALRIDPVIPHLHPTRLLDPRRI
jgi:hypothetical protein